MAADDTTMAAHAMDQPRIVLAVEHGTWCHDLFLAGFAQAIDRPVSILLRREAPSREAIRRWSGERPDALVVLGAGEQRSRTWLRRLAAPSVAVEFTPVDDDDDLAVDERAVGALAADHLLGRGVRRAVYAVSGRGGRQRGEGFARHLEAHGFPSGILRLPDAESEQRGALRAWLRQQEPGLGVFCYNDLLAAAMAAAAGSGGTPAIGRDLLLLGADDHPFIGRLATPGISSVRVPHAEVGAAAWRQVAARLDGMPAVRQRIAPAGVAVRASTSGMQISDPLAAATMAAIAAADVRTLSTDALVRAIGAPRRTIERHFRAALGRGLHEEIMRLRLERARCLLSDGDRSLCAIATDCGFADATGLHRAFRRAFAMAPGAWRERYRLAAAEARPRS